VLDLLKTAKASLGTSREHFNANASFEQICQDLADRAVERRKEEVQLKREEIQIRKEEMQIRMDEMNTIQTICSFIFQCGWIYILLWGGTGRARIWHSVMDSTEEMAESPVSRVRVCSIIVDSTYVKNVNGCDVLGPNPLYFPST